MTAGLFSAIAVLPLIAVLVYVLIKGGQKISFTLLTELPPPPGLEGGGIENAIIGSFVVTIIAALIAIPVGVGGGIFLAEYPRRKVRAPSALEPTSFRCSFHHRGRLHLRNDRHQQSFVKCLQRSRRRHGVVDPDASHCDQTTDVFSWFQTIFVAVPRRRRLQIRHGGTYHAPHSIHANCHWSGVSDCQGGWRNGAADLHALFSPFWSEGIDGIFNPIATLSVLIYNFAIMPYEAQNELAWAALFVLVLFILL